MSDNLPERIGHSVRDIQEMAGHVAKSRLFGLDAEQAFALMLLAQSEGLHPAKAFQRFHVIQGRPAMRADAMLAEFQARGGRVQWVETTDTKCRATFFHQVQAPKGVTVEFSMADAKRAGLGGKDTWQKYPANMLRARVISMGIRMVLPGIVCGIYTPEEVADFEPPPPQKPTIEIERNETDDPGSQPPYETWNDFARRVVSQANADWFKEQMEAGIEEEDQRELLNVYQLCNAVVKRALAADPPLLTQAELAAHMTPGGSHNTTARRAVADLWERHPRRVAATVERYVQAELEAARACLYESDSDPDEAASETVVTGSREPGED